MIIPSKMFYEYYKNNVLPIVKKIEYYDLANLSAESSDEVFILEWLETLTQWYEFNEDDTLDGLHQINSYIIPDEIYGNLESPDDFNDFDIALKELTDYYLILEKNLTTLFTMIKNNLKEFESQLYKKDFDFYLKWTKQYNKHNFEIEYLRINYFFHMLEKLEK